MVSGPPHNNMYVFGATPHSRSHVRVLEEIRALKVDIVPITEVSRVGPRLRRDDLARGLVSAWSNFLLDAEEHLAENETRNWGYDTFGKALWQLLLVFDLSRQDLHEPGWHLGAAEHVPPFFFREQRVTNPAFSPDDDFLESTLSALESTIPGKCLFRGEDDSIGIMCQSDVQPREGDMVCTIKGSYADFVLREYLGGYKIIGKRERSKRGEIAIGDIWLHRWAETTQLYAFYEELWTSDDGHRILIY
ncbi:hypothetical protein F5Y03DRAFT_406522 [Xylaria venustula]|nr:hypothetical protein F5Y03DRAFT_406522 [Xylaria venustula]